MTDITDQDRRAALAFAREIPNLVGPHTGASAAARVILAIVDAPAPTLAEELAAPLAGRPNAETVVFDADTVCRFITRAEQIEQERDQAREDAARIADERDRSDAQAQGLRANILDLHIEVQRLTAERDDRPATDLPDPADVPAGEAWSAIHEGVEVTAVRKAGLGGAAWMVVRRNGDSGAVMLRDVTLVSRLVPEAES